MRTFLQRGCMYAVPQFQKSFPFDQKQQASPKPHLIFEHFCSFYIFLVNKLQNMLSKRQKKASISKSFLNLQKLMPTSYCQCKKVNIKVTNQKVWFWYISKVVDLPLDWSWRSLIISGSWRPPPSDIDDGRGPLVATRSPRSWLAYWTPLLRLLVHDWPGI